jgi:hypothetical protein
VPAGEGEGKGKDEVDRIDSPVSRRARSGLVRTLAPSFNCGVDDPEGDAEAGTSVASPMLESDSVITPSMSPKRLVVLSVAESSSALIENVR